jgi:poly(glycerol-phosphate) alpha-glucosyltransferase
LSRAAFGRVIAACPDIVHIHGIWTASSIIGRYAAAHGIATVVSPHGMLEPWILQRSRAKKTVHGRLFERPLIARSMVHALNVAEDEAVRGYAGSRLRGIALLPNGIDLPTAAPSANKSGALFLGRLHEKKQVAELVQRWGADPALAHIPLRIAGPGADDYVQRVRAAADATANVRYVGPVYGQDKTVLLAEAAFFLLPSRSEGLPMAVLEAIAEGCVPVITPECNLPELIERGCAIPMRADWSDWADVAAVMAAITPDDMAARANLSRAVATDYAWPTIGAAMLDHYAALLSAHGDNGREKGR